MEYFQTKNPDLGKFWRVLQWKLLEYNTTIWSIFRILRVFVYVHFEHFMVLWYFFPDLVCCTKKNLAALHIFPSSSSTQHLSEMLQSGWPDWANFTLLGDYSLSAVF
jgi:hypothetical protein